MKQEWEVKKLVDVCIVERGSSPRPIDKYTTNDEDGVNWIKIGDTKGVDKYIFSTKEKITKEGALKSRYVKEGDFILSNSMSFGRPYIMKTDGYIHDGWFVLRLHDFIDTEFFYHLLSSPLVNEQFHKLASGSVVKNISGDLVKKVILPIPPLPEQQRIVGILDEVFDGIAKAKANAEQNLKNAQELFESYLQSVFETKGEGWEEKTLGEVVVLIDSLHRTPSYQSEGYPMVRVTDIKTGFLSLDKTKKVDRETFDEFSKKHIPKIGDIVLARVGSYGVSSIVNSDEPFCLGQNTVFILPKINSNYVYFFLNSPYAKKQLDKMVAGTTQPTISLKSIKEVSMPLPNLIDQQTIVQKLDALSLETKKLETIYLTKITDLEELKKSILHKAFNGELK